MILVNLISIFARIVIFPDKTKTILFFRVEENENKWIKIDGTIRYMKQNFLYIVVYMILNIIFLHLIY